MSDISEIINEIKQLELYNSVQTTLLNLDQNFTSHVWTREILT